jgi:hypothetical protein
MLILRYGKKKIQNFNIMDRDELKRKIQQASKIRELSGQSIQKQTLPPFKQMVQNVGQSVVRNVQSVVDGNPLNVSDDEKNRRLSICNSCEFYIKEQERCSKCGCYMAVKTYLKAESCPVGKW